MTEGNAVVIAAIITVGGMVFIFLLTVITNHFQKKTEIRETFFYEVYPKRLAVYEEAIRELQTMKEKGKSLMTPGLEKKAVVDRISLDRHFLKDLLTRIRMFGSPQTIVIFTGLIIQGGEKFSHLDNAGYSFSIILGSWIDTVGIALTEFVEAVRKDTGGNLVDETIRIYFSAAKGGRFRRLKDKLFPSKIAREMEKWEKYMFDDDQKEMRRGHNSPINKN